MNIEDLLQTKVAEQEPAPAPAVRPPSPGAREAFRLDLLPYITSGVQDAGFAGEVQSVLDMVQHAHQSKDMLYDRLSLRKPMEQSDEFYYEDLKVVVLDWVAVQKKQADSPQAQLARLFSQQLTPELLQKRLASFLSDSSSRGTVEEGSAVRVAGTLALPVERDFDTFFLYFNPEAQKWGDLEGNSRVAAEKLVEFLRL